MAISKAVILGCTPHVSSTLKTINDIIQDEKSIKITNPYKDIEQLSTPTMLYASVSEKLYKYGKRRGSNLTPKKKKRKK